MIKSCPECGSRDLRISHRRGLGQILRGLIGFYPLRCGECHNRMEVSVWNIRLFRYAHCPKCLRTDLSKWSQNNYIVPWSTRMILKLGASPYRCETCRCNFTSFRSRRERFSWRKQRELALIAASGK